MAVQKLTGLASKRTLLPVDDVPQVDTRSLVPERAGWLTPGVIVAMIAGGVVLLLGYAAAVAYLAQQDLLTDVGDFLARDTPLTSAVVTFLLAVAGYLKLRSIGTLAQRAGDAANNAEAHVGKVLPDRLEALVRGLEGTVKERTEPLQHVEALHTQTGGQVAVVPASSAPDAAGVPLSYGYPPEPLGPEPGPQRGRRREPTGAMPAVTAQTEAPFAWTQTGGGPAVAEPGETAAMTAYPWDEPSETR